MLALLAARFGGQMGRIDDEKALAKS